MFDHVTIRAGDREASERFYATVLAVLGHERTDSDAELARWGDFWVAPATAERPVTGGLHIGFTATSRELVDEFWRVGTAAGYRDDGPPGPRPQYAEDYYGSFLLDPDGNSAEAVHHGRVRREGCIDHLWIRVADVDAAKRFYETIGPRAGFDLRAQLPDRVRFAGSSGSFSLVDGTPLTRHVHLAFPAAGDAAGDALAVDPDGNGVEIVTRRRA